MNMFIVNAHSFILGSELLLLLGSYIPSYKIFSCSYCGSFSIILNNIPGKAN